MTHVTFDGPNKLIIVDYGVTEFDVQEVYSEWKQWMEGVDNSKYLPAMRTIGGDPTSGIKSVAPYFFLTNGWKIRPYEGDHYLNIGGNLFVDEPETYGEQVFIHTVGDYMVTVAMKVTSDAVALTPDVDVNATEIAAAVWDRLLSLHAISGSAGDVVKKTKSAVDDAQALIMAGY